MCRISFKTALPINSFSSQKGLHESNIRKWVLLYRTYGKTGLLSRKNQNYSVDFKLKVLKAIDKEHLSLSETRVKFNISLDSIIIKWQKGFTTFGLE